jgi:uncharacterized pyridoxal phosphate-containing UPF0001 family protein
LDIVNKIDQLAKAQHTNITICAAAKTRSLAHIIKTVTNININHIGENYVQEAEQKYFNTNDKDEWIVFKHKHNIKLRLIGSLQSNKVHKAITMFDSIDTVHSLKLANLLNKACSQLPQEKKLEILVQYNTLS